MEIIERAAPGVVELVGQEGGPGFDVRLAQRPFPSTFEPELKLAAEAVLAGSGGERPGIFARLLSTVRGWLSAST